MKGGPYCILIYIYERRKIEKSYLFWKFCLFDGAGGFILNLNLEVWEIIWGKKTHKARQFLPDTLLDV